MFTSARLAQLGLLAAVAVFGSSMTILGYASFSKTHSPKPVEQVVDEAPVGQPAFFAMDTPEKQH